MAAALVALGAVTVTAAAGESLTESKGKMPTRGCSAVSFSLTNHKRVGYPGAMSSGKRRGPPLAHPVGGVLSVCASMLRRGGCVTQPVAGW